MPQYHEAKIKNGKLSVDNESFLRAVRSLPDGDYILSITKQHHGSTREFQKLYFAILGEWSNDMGWTKDELHELVKNELFVELFEHAVSTSELSTAEWNIVMNNIETFLITKFENI